MDDPVFGKTWLSCRASFHRGHNGQWTLFTAYSDWGGSSPVLSSKVLVKENEEYYFRHSLQNDSMSLHFKDMDTYLVNKCLILVLCKHMKAWNK